MLKKIGVQEKNEQRKDEENDKSGEKMTKEVKGIDK